MTSKIVIVAYETKFRGAIKRSEKWRWRVVHENGKVLARSSEGYANRGEALRVGKNLVTGAYDVVVLD